MTDDHLPDRAGQLHPGDSLGFAVNRVARSFAAALSRRIQRFSVAPAQFGVLLLLYDRDMRTQAELATDFEVEQPTMARTLQRMERDALIQRVPDPTDRRRALVKLTETAQNLRAVLIAEATAVNTAATAGVSADDLAAFSRVLDRLAANLGHNDERHP